MTQLELFDEHAPPPPLPAAPPAVATVSSAPYAQGSATSRAAAEAIAPVTGRIASEVLGFIRDRGPHGCTDEELVSGLGLRIDTVRARRCELRDAGHVRDSGRTRPSSSNRRMTVWIASAGDGIPF